MEPGAIFVLLVVWAIGSLVAKAGKASQQQRNRPQRPLPVPRPRAEPGSYEDLLAEMRRQLEQARDLDERGRESVEVAPVVVTRSLPVPAPSQAPVDFDDQAEALVRRRVDLAEARNREWRPADHAAFDAKIRKAKAAAPASSVARPGLRQALIWSEVLRPPVSLRTEIGEG